MIKQYRKKPVVIEAVVWDGENVDEVVNFCDTPDGSYVSVGNGVLKIETLEGTMIASLNDYIIKGVNGEFYPCKPDIFEKTYEVV